jgi:hypothetical protein
VHDGGWIRLKGYKYFEVPVRRAAAVAARRWKNARCARVFDPRGALAFAFSGHFPPQELLATSTDSEPPELLQTCPDKGPRGFTGSLPITLNTRPRQCPLTLDN